ncbi:MAG: SpoVG family protein [Firmicutes bacterium]|nr:SpoVG family protein [Bacillota bacterium]
MAKVTDVRIRKSYEEDSKVKAIVSVTLDDAYVVHGLKVLKSDDGFYIAMPSKKLKEGDYKDIFHPISTESRQTLQKEVLELFEIELAKMTQEEEE